MSQHVERARRYGSVTHPPLVLTDSVPVSDSGPVTNSGGDGRAMQRVDPVIQCQGDRGGRVTPPFYSARVKTTQSI